MTIRPVLGAAAEPFGMDYRLHQDAELGSASCADGATTLGTKVRRYAYILPFSGKMELTIAIERLAIRKR